MDSGNEMRDFLVAHRPAEERWRRSWSAGAGDPGADFLGGPAAVPFQVELAVMPGT